jgi:hypothetical protein
MPAEEKNLTFQHLKKGKKDKEKERHNADSVAS